MEHATKMAKYSPLMQACIRIWERVASVISPPLELSNEKHQEIKNNIEKSRELRDRQLDRLYDDYMKNKSSLIQDNLENMNKLEIMVNQTGEDQQSDGFAYGFSNNKTTESYQKLFEINQDPNYFYHLTHVSQSVPLKKSGYFSSITLSRYPKRAYFTHQRHTRPIMQFQN